jgi:hypothetical protein
VVLALNLVEALCATNALASSPVPCRRFIQVTVGIPSGFQNGADGTGERNPDVSNK